MKHTIPMLLAVVLIVGLVVFLILNPASPNGSNQRQPEDTSVQDTERSFLSNQATCSTTEPDVLRVINEPFRVTDSRGAGTAMVEGQIVSRDTTILGERVTAVYLQVASSSPSSFSSYNSERVERGNTVNRVEENRLLYKLGILTDGTLESSAAISERARSAIEQALTNNEEITLLIQAPLYEGTEAPTDFTFACSVILQSS
ncbi:hypothetical protein KJ669_00985 [Patescibacteria group bacterium]|nr:hypothetical protein [Patescibacteria group bacterium]MBU2123835.1 hypothetical protein [Patescibacteria group bacterium]MBU2194874.1 hypothetical protein [Patescibacteria group bacterium]MBU2330128.1 hypothetical protein [Patescibacteria group bacterium]